jgi:eukaryotic-like serine/threonine-protein kinase
MSRRPAPPAVKEIARGGSGTVALAFRRERAAGFRRMVAVKRLRQGLRDDDDARAMFLREARVTGELRHPNVVGVQDVGEDTAGPYLVMDFVFGLSLRELRDLLAERGVVLPLQLALRIAVAIARGLRAAHELTDREGEPLGLIHRDVSPSNVLVGFDGVVRLVDFGLARVLEDVRSGELLRGTSGYVAPEQLRFEPLDARADLFVLGVVLTELVTGERLYGEGDVRVAARRILTEDPPDLRRTVPELPEEVAQLLDRLLAKAPHERPMGAAEVEEILERAIREQVLHEGPLDLVEFLEAHLGDLIDARRLELAELWRRFESGPAEAAVPTPEIRGAERTAPQVSSRRPRLIAMAAAVALLLVGVWWSRQDATPPATRERTEDRATAPTPAEPEALPVRLERSDAGPEEAVEAPAPQRRRASMRARGMRGGGRELWEW